MHFAKPPELPFLHESFAPQILKCIEKAISDSISYLIKVKFKNKLVAEITINIALQERLNELLLDKSCDYFSPDLFQDVTRDASVSSYIRCDGKSKHLEKKPDLTFKLSGWQRAGVKDRTNDGLFVECKLIENSDTSIYAYCKNGVSRFVDGEYAWAMPNAIMIAYNRSNNSFFKSLDKYMDNREKYNLLSSSFGSCGQFYVSTHDRKWTYFNHSKPKEIEIKHLCFDFN